MSSNYTLASVPSYGKRRTDGYWEVINLAASCATLFINYRQIEVAIKDSFDMPHTFKLYDSESSIRYSNVTVAAWLASRGNFALKTVDGYPTLNIADIPYIPAHYAAGTMAVAQSGKHPSYSTVGTEANDIIYNLNETIPSVLHNTSLFSVNGFYHPTTYHSYGVRILHAGDNVRAARRAEIGFLSFAKVGAVKQVPITEDMVHKLDVTKSYWDRITIDANTSLYGKTVGIVIGGYLHLLDNVLRVNGDETVTLSLRNVNIAERVMQSKDTLDLSFMAMDDIDSSAVVSHTRSEQAILKYITSKYSFLVVIDNPDLMLDVAAVSDAAMEGTYISTYERGLGLLRDSLGMTIDYWAKAECGLWAMKTNYRGIKSKLFKDSGWHALTRINDASEGRELKLPKELKLCQYTARIK